MWVMRFCKEYLEQKRPTLIIYEAILFLQIVAFAHWQLKIKDILVIFTADLFLKHISFYWIFNFLTKFIIYVVFYCIILIYINKLLYILVKINPKLMCEVKASLIFNKDQILCERLIFNLVLQKIGVHFKMSNVTTLYSGIIVSLI